MGGADTVDENDELQCLSFPYSVPNVFGRGFIEVCASSGVSHHEPKSLYGVSMNSKL